MQPGIHLLHKPAGPTSFAIVQACKDAIASSPKPPARSLKLCHGGTLDPFAHGLLLILVGPATRLFDHLHAIPKIYEATIRWGVETDNGDPLGKPTFTGDASKLSANQLADAITPFIGWHDQIPPATSNKRIDGERAYAKAHRGETVVLPPSRVYLHEACWLDHDLPDHSHIRLTVRGGYYIRALVRDLGRSLGCGAHLADLHRTAIGPWNDPGPAAGVAGGADQPLADQQSAVATPDLLPWASTRILTDQDVGELRQERAIALGNLLAPTWPLPNNFPDSAAPIRGVHRDRLRFLLTPAEQKLRAIASLGAGL